MNSFLGANIIKPGGAGAINFRRTARLLFYQPFSWKWSASLAVAHR